jgi:hypothetical protein
LDDIVDIDVDVDVDDGVLFIINMLEDVVVMFFFMI